MRIHQYYVYILTTTHNKVLYIGITNDLERRCHEHKMKLFKGFTQRYNVDKLVYFEIFDLVDHAIAREKQLKGYSRIKKLHIINQFNNDWKELYLNGKIEFLPQIE
jgi:putative endonuclease